MTRNLPKYLHINFQIWFPKSNFKTLKYIKNVLVHSLRTPDLNSSKNDFWKKVFQIFFQNFSKKKIIIFFQRLIVLTSEIGLWKPNLEIYV